MSTMKIKAKAENDVVSAKVMIKHDMLTYDQAKTKGTTANFMTHISAKVGETVVYDMSTSQFLSKNPVLKFKFKNAGFKKGDQLEMTWSDLSGATSTEAKEIKGL